MSSTDIAIVLGVVAILAAILIVAFPFLLNIIVAIALAVAGAVVIYQGIQRRAQV
jgi:uncharacterized membrane protein